MMSQKLQGDKREMSLERCAKARSGWAFQDV